LETILTLRRYVLLAMKASLAAVGIAWLMASVVQGHGSEARYVEEIQWKKPRIAHTYALSYTELGIGAGRGIAQMRTIGNRQCVTGATLGFDVDDQYAFDIDEPVTVKLTYATQFSKPFAIYWDASSGEGLGRRDVAVEPGEQFREVTVTLERARFAGQGTRGVDIAVGAGFGGTLALCDVEVTRSNATKAAQPAGQLQLELRDAASGQPIPARVGLYDASGRLPLPSNDALLVHRFSDEVRRLWVSQRAFWPTANRQAFYVNGRYSASVPAGSYELVVARGIEYRAHRGRVEVRPGQTATVRVDLQRYADLVGRGWYSGDGHVHIGRDIVRDEPAWAHTAGEDVRLANLVQMGNLSRTHFDQPAWGKAGQFERGGYVIVSGQEDPRTVQHGHTLHHNLQAPVHLSTDEYFSYQHAFEEAKRQGGVSGYAHHGELFNGRRGLALDVPFGIVDFIEVLQNGRLATDAWYGFLNLGYKILPNAGSDYPYMDLPGVVRNYAKIDGAFTPEAWFDAFRSGRMYVTNGPFLELRVNGQPMGSELRVAKDSRVEVVAEADLNPEVDALSHIELVVHGDVVATEQANGQNRIALRAEVAADRSKWLAVRAWGKRQERSHMTIAHSAPVYIVVNGQPFWKTEALPALVAEQRGRLDEFVTATVDPRGDLEPWETLALMQQEWERQRALLKPRVEEAHRRYQLILDRAGAFTAPQAAHYWPLVGFIALLLTTRARRRRLQRNAAAGAISNSDATQG
jgi:hypothetical protein